MKNTCAQGRRYEPCPQLGHAKEMGGVEAGPAAELMESAENMLSTAVMEEKGAVMTGYMSRVQVRRNQAGSCWEGWTDETRRVRV